MGEPQEILESRPLSGLLEESALEQGFALAATVDYSKAREIYATHVKRYDDWLSRGFAGEMGYLQRGRDRRAHPEWVFPDLRSVLCVALPYSAHPLGEPSAAKGARYARYLRERDYHSDLSDRLNRALASANRRWLSLGNAELKWKVCVDTSAVLERSWAAIAGLGWIGKNTLLIHPKHGSYLFLGVAFLNQETGRWPSPMRDYCGHCTRCLRACPTKALVPHELDSNRCISYWTLEKRGELSLSKQDRDKLGNWIAGCDICQEACPFNAKASKASRAPGCEPPWVSKTAWDVLVHETAQEYQDRVRGSALSRVKPEQFKRNIELAFADSRRREGFDTAPRARDSRSENEV